MDTMGSAINSKAVQSRRTFWLVLLVCVAPVALSTLIWWMDWGPSSKLNAGILVQPVTSVTSCLMKNNMTTRESMAPIKGKWGLVVVDPLGENDPRLHLITQLKIMQGKERGRIEPYVVSAIALNSIEKSIHVLQGQWCLNHPKNAITVPIEQRVYVFDPLGNIMLVLDARVKPKLMNKDLARLLLVSRIG
jgi:hypothetical protein